MRFLILNIVYPQFLRQLYPKNTNLYYKTFEEQQNAYNQTFFGISDAYPQNLQTLGHEADQVHINNIHMQRTWAREHGQRAMYAWPLPYNPVISFLPFAAPWYYKILEAQIEHYKPDVTINLAIREVGAPFLKRMKSQLGFLVGQIASPYNPKIDLSPYDLMLSSLPNFVHRFQQSGIPASLFRLGFDPRIHQRITQPKRDIPISFVGTISSAHSKRNQWLETLCEQLPVKVWGQGIKNVHSNSAIAKAYQGQAWGRDMFHILARSRITLNRHINIAENFANNMRLYEATGMGAMLLTDQKDNLTDMFTPNSEVVTYTNTDDCLQQATHYLDSETQRQRIAQAGQQRTFTDHSYEQRMKQLVSMLESMI